MLDIFGKADGLLAAVVAALGAAGRPVPERAYVERGTKVALDCEQVTVTVGPVVNGPAGGTIVPGLPFEVRPWMTTLNAYVLRCSSNGDDAGNPRHHQDISDEAEDIYRDGAALVEAAKSFAGRCHDIANPSVSFPGPMGETAMAVLTLQVNL